LNKNGAYFDKIIDVNIFEAFQPKVVISQNGIQKTESLKEYMDIYNKFLLQIEGYYNGSTRYSDGKHIYKGGNIELRITNRNSSVPEFVSIIYDINGNTLKED